MSFAYRSNTRQCTNCTVPVEEDHLLSLQGTPICDSCFVTQARPLPMLTPGSEVAECTSALAQRALWLHAFGGTGWLGVASAGLGLEMLLALPGEGKLGGLVLLAIAVAAFRAAYAKAAKCFQA
ncbi:MAG: hypothetical protein RMJ98_12510 [Myxococcales bacterium]|nr:hypothetical protein [Polyangiaceae bacterium]MDW8250109.1 hypothetical protein [Myxococcales bacterium]